MSIKVVDINFDINNQPLFKEPISLELNAQERILLYGSSGCGKTTILKMMTFLLSPSCGEVYYGDNKITSFEYANKIRAKYISIIPSSFSFFESLSIEENITASAYFAKIPKPNILLRLEYLYDTFNFTNKQISLKNLKNKQISALSNGQKEILMIARSFMFETKFIFADELLRSFNPEDKEDIFHIFKNTLRHFSNGLFMISHEDRFKKDLFIDKIFSIKDQTIKEQFYT